MSGIPTMELPALWTWLGTVLTADLGVASSFGNRIYSGSAAPPEATYPLLLFFLRSGVDENCIGVPPSRCALDTITFIRGVALPEQYLSHLAPGLTAVEAALWGRDEIVGGHRFQVVGARGPIEYDDPPGNGVPIYTNLGRDWMISVYPAA